VSTYDVKQTLFNAISILKMDSATQTTAMNKKSIEQKKSIPHNLHAMTKRQDDGSITMTHSTSAVTTTMVPLLQ